jgi:hypothetical protein
MEILNEEAIGHLMLIVTTIQVPDEGIVVVKDLYDSGNIIDSQYLDKNGYAIEDPVLIERIDNFMEYKESRILSN